MILYCPEYCLQHKTCRHQLWPLLLSSPRYFCSRLLWRALLWDIEQMPITKWTWAKLSQEISLLILIIGKSWSFLIVSEARTCHCAYVLWSACKTPDGSAERYDVMMRYRYRLSKNCNILQRGNISKTTQENNHKW